MSKSSVVCSLIAVALLAGCAGKSEPVAIGRLDLASRCENTDSVTNVFRPALEALSRVAGGISPDSVLARYRASAAQRVFGPDIKERLSDLSAAESELGSARARLQEEFPEMRFPSFVYGYATPYNQSVVVVDTVLLIGLNHYLGADYAGYEGFEEYRRALKTPERLVPDVVEAVIATNNPYAPGPNATVLSRLLYEGALLYAMDRALPEADEALLMGYDPQQMEWARVNEGRVWQRLVESEMLFSTDPAVADKLVAPAPGTLLVNANAPGRIGRYIGLKIVEAYLKSNPEATPAELLSAQFYALPQVLHKARYAP
ncbi:MAG: hypothetical protein NC338_00580 [Firmicutes bacterium]|nr:hypothetical protein [Bacillota bacterium]MCM1400615.1 hypothetical protein [Bacteroides sp.]MCM1477883.1 hypothetical protein [Bacteroides sp.]